MFKNRINPAVKSMKAESSDDAIKRGVTVQTTFFSESEKKKKGLEDNEKEVKYIAEHDMFSAAMYKAYNLK